MKKEDILIWILLIGILIIPFSFKAQAYEQQYNVGDTGPNGGVVTSVAVGSVLSDSFTELVGDFLETTDTYTYTETIIEEVENTTYETVQETQEITTSNILPENYTVYGGTHVCTDTQCYGMTGADFTTGNESMGMSGHLYDIDLSDYENMIQIKYGSIVYSHSSNSSVPDCANTTGDCRDDFAIAIRLYNQGELVFEKVNSYIGIDWSGSQTYDYTQDVSSYTFDSAQMGLAGVDQGFSGGYYGPGFSDYFFEVTYNQISEIINTITSIIEYETIKTTDEYVYSSEYVPPPPEIVFDDVVVDLDTSFEMEFENFDGDIVSFEIEIVEADTGDFEIEMTTFEDDLEVEVETIEIDMEEMVEELDVEVETTEVEPDSEPVEEPTVEAEEETKQEDSKPTETKERVAQKIMAKVAEMGDQIALNNIKLAVMTQLADTQQFNNYALKTLTDSNINDYLSVTIEDQYGMLFDMAQDNTIQEMIDAQY
jgi:hypothetical protein